jgi:glycerophosphoryl diester phosphodiesterase
VVTSPAGARSGITARDLPRKQGGHTPTAVQVIGHAGLAIQSEGGVPTRRHLDEALALGVDRIEVDVCATADRALVVRHDVSLGDRRTHHVQRVVVGLWRSHASLSGLRRGVVDVHRAARQLRERPQESLANLAGLPWRARLPMDVAQTREDVAAAGMCVHHWVVSERLVEEAHSFGLHVNTWTVNNPFAARTVAAAGVDSITTDSVHLVRVALRSEQPDPQLRAGPPLRAVVRIAPS